MEEEKRIEGEEEVEVEGWKEGRKGEGEGKISRYTSQGLGLEMLRTLI